MTYIALIAVALTDRSRSRIWLAKSDDGETDGKYVFVFVLTGLTLP